MFDPSILPDEKLTENVQNSVYENECLKELIARHTGVYVKVANQFRDNPYVKFDDVLDQKDYNIYRAAQKFDAKKAKFDTLVGSMARCECLHYISRGKRNKNDEFEGEFESNEDVRQIVENHEFAEIIDETLGEMDAKSRKIFTERYFNSNNIDKPTYWKDIGKKAKLTNWGTILSNRRTVKKIREKLEIN